MLEITIPEQELFNERTSEFITTKPVELRLEHSLVSLSKWEEKYHKPFLTTKEMTREETIDYIRMMTVTQNVNPNVYKNLPNETSQEILKYIEDSHTATTIRETKGSKSKEVITSEIIYYWMIAFEIPFECQRWHLNRLLTLIRVCNIKQQKQKPMKRSEILASNKALNAQRRAAMKTKG